MQFIVTDRSYIERGLVVRSAYIVISVRDPGRARPRVRRGAGFRDVIFLAFHDAEPTVGFRLPRGVVLMSQQDAEKIVEFVNARPSDTGAIVCHCEQGMSRSPAIAIALAEMLGEDTAALCDYATPNRYVLELMRAACKRSLPSDQMPG